MRKLLAISLASGLLTGCVANIQRESAKEYPVAMKHAGLAVVCSLHQNGFRITSTIRPRPGMYVVQAVEKSGDNPHSHRLPVTVNVSVYEKPTGAIAVETIGQMAGAADFGITQDVVGNFYQGVKHHLIKIRAAEAATSRMATAEDRLWPISIARGVDPDVLPGSPDQD